MNIHLVQYLCPSRHAIVALLYDKDETTPEQAEQIARDSITALRADPWCALCRSRELRFEHARMREQDWDKAVALTKGLELENLLSRIAIDEARKGTN